MKVAVIGAGVLGRNIARTFLRAGDAVTLHSRTRADACEVLADETLATTTDVGAAAEQADLVIESVPEDLRLKRAILADVEAAAPADATIATNTSSLPLAEMAVALRRTHRCLCAAPVQSGASRAARGARAGAGHGCGRCAPRDRDPGAGGQAPAGSRACGAGIRRQPPLVREALQLVEDGVVDAAGIDAALTDCLGPRWAAIGPTRSTDLAGVETTQVGAAQLLGVHHVVAHPAARQPRTPFG